MTAELVERLRHLYPQDEHVYVRQAADRIEQDEAQLYRLGDELAQEKLRVMALEARCQAAESARNDAQRAVQNCLLEVPAGKFKDDMNAWLDAAIAGEPL